MESFIIRLDDACPNMNWEKWQQMEELLDCYQVRPIVGVIPDNRDKEFVHACKGDFWDLVRTWQKKGYTIAQHGLHHVIAHCGKQKFFQMTHDRNSEFAGRMYEDQVEVLRQGYQIMKSHGVTPDCFFAPAHTFDHNTVRAIRSLGYYRFISDGYALRPYQKDGVLFLPSLFDAPRRLMPWGVYTFVFHPNQMEQEDFARLEDFLKAYSSQFVSAIDYVVEYQNIDMGQGVLGRLLEIVMYLLRGIRRKIV